jgi:hypothetical protein
MLAVSPASVQTTYRLSESDDKQEHADRQYGQADDELRLSDTDDRHGQLRDRRDNFDRVRLPGFVGFPAAEDWVMLHRAKSATAEVIWLGSGIRREDFSFSGLEKV